MITRLLIGVIVVILAVVASYFKKNKDNFSHVLAGDKPKEPIAATFGQFGQVCLVLAILGIPFFILGQIPWALVYIALVMVASAIFSIKLTKVI